MSDEAQGVEHAEPVADATNEAPVNEIESIQDDAQAEAAQEVQETVEVDYQAEHEQLTQALKASQTKIDRQRAASSQHNEKIKQLNEQLSSLHKPEVPQAPQEDDFETFDDFNKATIDFAANQRFEELKTADLQAQKQREFDSNQKQQREAFQTVEAEYKVNNPDYSRARTELEDHIQLSPSSSDVQNAIYEAAQITGSVPAIIDYFGKDNGANLSDWDRIVSLSPAEAAIEVYKISLKAKVDVPQKAIKPKSRPLNPERGGSKATQAVKGMGAKDTLAWIKS